MLPAHRRHPPRTRAGAASCVLLALLAVGPQARANASPPQAEGVANLPVLVVDRDDFVVTTSCRLVLPASPIVDAAGDGVVQIRGEGLRVVCEGGPLRGAPTSVDPDRYTGVGFDVEGRNVTVVGARVGGFKVGLLARGCDGLRVVGGEFDDLFRQRLGSTWSAEDPGGWLTPHDNDQGQWVERYGGAVVVERSTRSRLEGVRVRRSQNGILLDRSDHTTVMRCDASFLSGWGLALWRASDNVVRGNRFDYCIRGYSHGRYNRGQDSAGVLLFEQSSRNLFELNSVTHGGDGVFGFAGREALGQVRGLLGFDYLGAGCNGNTFRFNDLSFAAAHGLELTFSFDNRIEQNLFEANAICGVWYGYGRNSTFTGNRFVRNGDAGYGLERGAINAEHGRGLVVIGNSFVEDAVGVRLWTDEDPGLAETPWAQVNGTGARGNALLSNRFVGVDPIAELVGADDTIITPADPAAVVADERSLETLTVEVGDGSNVAAPAEQPGSARTRMNDALSRAFHGLGPADRLPLERERRRVPKVGRASIVIDEWGPYDWSRPLVQPLERTGDRHRYRLLGPSDLVSVVEVVGGEEVDVLVDRALPDFPVGPDGMARAVITVQARRPGSITPYELLVRAHRVDLPVAGVLVDARWDVAWFASPGDPREDYAAWRAAAEAAPTHRVAGLQFSYGMAGPGAVAHAAGLGGAATDALAQLDEDHFGTLARTELDLPAGAWRLTTLSDDGVRVTVDGEALIDNWTWHGPERDAALLELEQPRTVSIEVEHFELDGYAVLELTLEPAPAARAEAPPVALTVEATAPLSDAEPGASPDE